MKTYHIADWNEHYENNRSRKVKDLAWVPIPNKHDGERYSRLMAKKDAAPIFAAWILILQVASRCHPRGSLVRNDGTPHDSESLSIKTRAPKAWFDAALPILAEIRWLTMEVVEQPEFALECHDPATTLPPSCQLGDEERIEGKGMERIERTGSGVSVFQAPSPEQVTDYSVSIGYPLNGQAWCDAYAQKGWSVGKSKMKDWKAAVRNWKANGWKPDGAAIEGVISDRAASQFLRV